jgi:hypothetical protein
LRRAIDPVKINAKRVVDTAFVRRTVYLKSPRNSRFRQICKLTWFGKCSAPEFLEIFFNVTSVEQDMLRDAR